ncbi:MAG: endo alpha-1,4 polygalactosaminidase [Firmicutes bacterium]|nr:endo alpha-1,4 polygalactosaminidase [Bacillota bacterium]
MKNKNSPDFKFILKMILIFIIPVIVIGCSGGSGGSGSGPQPTPTVTSAPLSIGEVTSWAIQLQNIETDESMGALASSDYDMLVIEPTRTDWSSENMNFDTAKLVSELQSTPASDGIHRKLVIAYVDIGQAEDYRWYWTWSKNWTPGQPFPDDWPSFIISPDPDGWAGDFPVAYWDPNWKDIAVYGKNQSSSPYGNYTSIIDEAIRDGFDGIYMDWVAGYEDEQVLARAEKDGVDAAQEMKNFISEIRTYAHQRKPGFIMIQQNGSTLDQYQPDILNVVDAISQEAVWYEGASFDDWDAADAADISVDTDLTNEYITNLTRWKKKGIPVFNVEYAVNNASEAYEKSRAEGFVPYCSRRPLSHLSTTPPF